MIDLNNMSPEEMELAEQKIAEKKYEQLKRRIGSSFWERFAFGGVKIRKTKQKKLKKNKKN